MKHPPFFSGPVDAPSESKETATDRAHRHARMIREAWARVGYDIRPVVLSINQVPCVRMPDLVNGLPRSLKA